MNIVVLGAAGFIGTNLVIKLAEDKNNHITLVDYCEEYFFNIKKFALTNITIIPSAMDASMNFKKILENQDIVYHSGKTCLL